MVVGEFKKARGRFEMDLVRGGDIVLEDLLFFCDWQEGKDPCASIIDHEDDQGIEAVFKERQGVDVMEKGQVSDDGEGGFLRPFGNPERSGDVAVDS